MSHHALGGCSMGDWPALGVRPTPRVGLHTQTIDEPAVAPLTSGADDAREAFGLLEQTSESCSRHPSEERARGLMSLVSNCKLIGEKVEPNGRTPFDLVTEGLCSGTRYALWDNFRAPVD